MSVIRLIEKFVKENNVELTNALEVLIDSTVSTTLNLLRNDQDPEYNNTPTEELVKNIVENCCHPLFTKDPELVEDINIYKTGIELLPLSLYSATEAYTYYSLAKNYQNYYVENRSKLNYKDQEEYLIKHQKLVDKLRAEDFKFNKNSSYTFFPIGDLNGKQHSFDRHYPDGLEATWNYYYITTPKERNSFTKEEVKEFYLSQHSIAESAKAVESDVTLMKLGVDFTLSLPLLIDHYGLLQGFKLATVGVEHGLSKEQWLKYIEDEEKYKAYPVSWLKNLL